MLLIEEGSILRDWWAVEIAAADLAGADGRDFTAGFAVFLRIVDLAATDLVAAARTGFFNFVWETLRDMFCSRQVSVGSLYSLLYAAAQLKLCSAI